MSKNPWTEFFKIKETGIELAHKDAAADAHQICLSDTEMFVSDSINGRGLIIILTCYWNSCSFILT